MQERAAQFSPFAALTGYNSAIAETARLTEQKRELGEYEREQLDRCFMQLKARQHEHPYIGVTHFVRDERKDGGSFVVTSGELKRIDEAGKVLYLTDGSCINISDITDLMITE